ncbi:MAG: hypothetical protein H5U06_11435 [Candidatus Aminicenantes bacterium]|nr:hypothetical protein [Candidatus Aminicenantes bacterium]
MKNHLTLIYVFLFLITPLNLSSQQIVDLDKMTAFNLGQIMEANNIIFIHPIDADIEGDNLFILDLRLSHILKINAKNGTLIKIISSKGQGPAELNFPKSLRVKNDLIYVGDLGYGGIKIFDGNDGSLIKAIKMNADFDDIDVYNNGDIVLKKADPISNSLICRFDKEGNKIGIIVKLDIPKNSLQKRGIDYIRDTFVRFHLDSEDNLILLKPLRRELFKYDKNGLLLWKKAVDNPVLKEIEEKDKISIESDVVNVTRYVFNVAVNDKGNIIVGHVGGGQEFNSFGETIRIFRGKFNLNTFLYSGNKIFLILLGGKAYIYEIPNI